VNTGKAGASKFLNMKNKLSAAALTVILAATGATAMAHERYADNGSYYRSRSYEAARYEAPGVLYDRYGNRVYVTRSQRYVAPAPGHCYRAPVVVPECHRAPVCEERRTSIRFEPPFFSPLRFLFGR
jgi:hypothetical protein